MLIVAVAVIFALVLQALHPDLRAPVPVAPVLSAANATPVALALQLNPSSGWGIFGLNMLALLPPAFDVLVTDAPASTCATMLDDDGRPQTEALRDAYAAMQRRQGHGCSDGPLWQRLAGFARDDRPRAVLRASGRDPDSESDPGSELLVLHGVASEFEDAPPAHSLWGAKNVGIAFFERDVLPVDAVRNAQAYDLVLVGSAWNLRTLRRLGVRRARLIKQGVDTLLFAPTVRRGGTAAALPLPIATPPPGRDAGDPVHTTLDDSKFVVFSGGKLELRKGQDLVVAAFKKFARLHADAVLATAWHSQWPASMRNIDVAPQKHVRGVPEWDRTADGEVHIRVGEWCARNGIARERAYHLQRATQPEIAALLQRADVALFPNRAEGGTNLVAMEAMASGVPVIISNNTGHTDIVDDAHCFPLRKQRVLKQRDLEGWSESFVEEIVFQLEMVYQDRADANARGRRAAAFIRSHYTWERAIETVADALSAAGSG
eukprot:g3177.t1